MDKWNRKLIVAVLLVSFYLFIGTVFFHFAEGWRVVDSFYFTGTTLTTVGYGDLHPTQDHTKIVAVLFAFLGIGIVFYSISIIGQKYFEREEERLQKIWENTRGKLSEKKEDVADDAMIKGANKHHAQVKRILTSEKL
jgi:voltage-gated potassium channel